MLAMNADEVGKSIEELASMLDKNAAPPAFSPDSQIRLHLVDKGSPNACVFDDIRQLQAGEEGALTLRSHRGLAICGRHPEQRRAGPWRYIEATAAGPQRDAVRVRLQDGVFLITTHDPRLTLDVTHWRMEAGNEVNLVGGTDRHHRTMQGGGGRDWLLCADIEVSETDI